MFLVAFAGWIALESSRFAFGGATLGTIGGIAGDIMCNFCFGDKLKKHFPISHYKISCWRESLSHGLEQLHKDCRKLIYQDIDQIHGVYSQMLNSFRDQTSIKIEALHKESHHLTIWANQLDQTYKYLQKKGNKLDTLLAGYVFAVITYKLCKLK